MSVLVKIGWKLSKVDILHLKEALKAGIMSLTSFLTNKNNQDVRDKFKQEFLKPKFSLNQEILAPPLTKNYSTVGTAFDYLLRFYLEYLNSGAITKAWIAYGSCFKLREILDELESNTKFKDMPKSIRYSITIFFKKIGYNSLPPRKNVIALFQDSYRKANNIVLEAKENHVSFLKSGEINDPLIKSALLLAQLEPIYRAGLIDTNIGIIDNRDIEDLRNLLSLFAPKDFKAKEICLLNPSFNYSVLVGGADADFVIDDMLIDIKTTKNLELRRSDFNQLIGYYALYKIGGINGMPQNYDIKHLGIYFSRYGYLYLIDIQRIIAEIKFINFLEWFKQRATESYLPDNAHLVVKTSGG